MIEDVTTSGKSIDETYPLVTGAARVEVKGLIVSLDRMEVGKGGRVTAQQEIQERYGFPVASIVSMAEVREALGGSVITPELGAALDAYYERYGVR
jgi:orotate phosphoribosyltransferase